jgi:phosphatidate phosphatase APP1
VIRAGAVARDLIAERLPRGPVGVVVYDGFGAGDRVIVQGRALRDERIAAPTPEDTRWRNLWAMVRRADADPLPHAVVHATIGESSQDFVADDEGFFSGWMPALRPLRIDEEWVHVGAELRSAQTATPLLAHGRALCPAFRPEVLVISDIDDTVLQSQVTNLVAAVRTMLFENARTRLPFPGVAAFYQALRRGASGAGRNPMFYVSSSPWNFYDVIQQFLEIQEIPSGPIILRDLDMGLSVMSSRHHHSHKREMIRRILTTFADIPAVLIGDSGQQDPEIYRDVVHDFRGRITAVYIRNVTPHPERSTAIQALAEEIVKAGSALVLADDTLAAAKHAVEIGLIAPDALGAISEEKKEDEGTKPGKAKA